MRILGHHSRYVVAASFSGRQVVVVLVCVAIFLGLLAGPVLGENIFDFFSTGAARVAPAAFLLGLGVLVAGLIVRVRILDVVGACLIGAVLLGAILINY
jgi:putative exporter of polyketide antibiotics